MKQQLMGEHQKIKDIIYGKNMNYEEMKNAWQEQSEYEKADNEFNNLLKQIGDANLADMIRNAVDAKECAYAYIQYKQGLFEGVKSVLRFKKT